MDLILCKHCGETVNSEFIEGSPYHQECSESHIPTCEEVVSEFWRTAQTDHILYMAIHANYLYGLKEQARKDIPLGKDAFKKEKREKRNLKLQELLMNVSALRNSNSGYLLIQLVGFAFSDTFTGAFDEFADERLLEVIDDGSLFADVFKKEIYRFQNQTFISLYVEGTSQIATHDFRTALALDSSIRHPAPATMRRFVSRKSHGRLPEFRSPVKDYTKLDFTESTRIQIKGVRKLEGSLKEKVWQDLRLREYISAFSKNAEGGVVIFGVGEVGTCFEHFEYQSQTWDFHGVSASTFDEVKAHIEHCVKHNLSVYGFDGKRREDTENIIKIRPVKIDELTFPNMVVEDEIKDNVLIEVAVLPVDGVVFHHEEGPLAYRVENKGDKPSRVNIQEWFDCMKKP